jgi:hypothetical protein
MDEHRIPKRELEMKMNGKRPRADHTKSRETQREDNDPGGRYRKCRNG